MSNFLQKKSFYAPVTKNSSGPTLIEVGDPLTLVLRGEGATRPTTRVYVASVEKGANGPATRIGWELGGQAVMPAATSAQIATADAADDTTGDALANALKTAYNAQQVDTAAFYTANPPLGSPTSVQNATTAATTDPTRIALANALRTNYAALRVDALEIIASNPDLSNHEIEAIVAPVAVTEGDAITLLNELKDKLNLTQTFISEALSESDTGYFIPRKEDVIGVDGSHQYNDPDQPGDDEELEGPTNPNA